MYVVSTYDPADDPCKDGEWTIVAKVPTPLRLRPIIRELRRCGYSSVSIAVDKWPGESPKGGE
jgi:hypothetical protein